MPCPYPEAEAIGATAARRPPPTVHRPPSVGPHPPARYNRSAGPTRWGPRRRFAVFRIVRFFFTVTMMGMFWLFGLIAGVFLGALFMSRQGQVSWGRIQSFG